MTHAQLRLDIVAGVMKNHPAVSSSSADSHVTFCDADLRALRALRPNALLIGGPPVTEAAIEILAPGFWKPITIRRADSPLILLAAPSSGTLILKEPATLSLDDQQRLDIWCRASTATQVVTTSTVPLLPFVERHLFLESLYYQLNALYVELIPA